MVENIVALFQRLLSIESQINRLIMFGTALTMVLGFIAFVWRIIKWIKEKYHNPEKILKFLMHSDKSFTEEFKEETESNKRQGNFYKRFKKYFVKFTEPIFSAHRFKDKELKSTSIKFKELLEYITDENDIQRVLTIYAEAGMGKSRLLRFLTYKLLLYGIKKKEKNAKELLPSSPVVGYGVYYTMFKKYKNIDALFQEIEEIKSNQEIKYLLLDGFDECREYHTGRYSSTIDFLKTFFEKLGNIEGISRILITSRGDMLKNDREALMSIRIKFGESLQPIDVIEMDRFTDKQVLERYKIVNATLDKSKSKDQSNITEKLKLHLKEDKDLPKDKKSILRIPFFIRYTNELFYDMAGNALNYLTREVGLDIIVKKRFEKEYLSYSQARDNVKQDVYTIKMMSALGKTAYEMHKINSLSLLCEEYEKNIPNEYKTQKERLFMVRESIKDAKSEEIQDSFHFQHKLFYEYFLAYHFIDDVITGALTIPLDERREFLGFNGTNEENEFRKRLYAHFLKEEKRYKEAIEKNISCLDKSFDVNKLLEAKSIKIIDDPAWKIDRIVCLLPLAESLQYRKFKINNYDDLKEYVNEHFFVLNPEALLDVNGVKQFGKLAVLDMTEVKIKLDEFENFLENFDDVDEIRVSIRNKNDLNKLINTKITKKIKLRMEIQPTDLPEFVQFVINSDLDEQKFSFCNKISADLFLNAFLHIRLDDTRYLNIENSIKLTADSETVDAFNTINEKVNKMLTAVGNLENLDKTDSDELVELLSNPNILNYMEHILIIEGSDYEIQMIVKKRWNFIEQLLLIEEKYSVCENNFIFFIRGIFYIQFKQYPELSDEHLCKLLQKRIEDYGKSHPYTMTLLTLYAESQCWLGKCYYDGDDGTEKDIAKAIEWFQKAADQNQVGAQYLLGKCYYEGDGVEKDIAKAIYWFQKAVDYGDIYALYCLGKCYYEGDGAEEDIAKAIDLFQKAADQDQEDAQYLLGECYYYGNGVDKNIAKAIELLQKATDQGQEDAQYLLGKCYYYGDGVEKDIAKAIELFQKAADQGNEDALKYVPETLKPTKQYNDNNEAFKHIPEDLKTVELCLEAVKQNGWELEFVPEDIKTAELCLEAVKQNGWALKFVPENLKTTELCFEAVKRNGWALEFVPENLKTTRLCFEAVKRNGWALEFVPENLKTIELCLEAVKQDIKPLLEYVPEDIKSDVKKLAKKYIPKSLKTAELCLEAVKQNGWVLEFVPENFKTAELCFEAVKQSSWALEFVPKSLKTAELCLEAVKQSGWVLEFVPKNLKTAELCFEAVKQNFEIFDYVPEPLKIKVKEAIKLFQKSANQGDTEAQELLDKIDVDTKNGERNLSLDK